MTEKIKVKEHLSADGVTQDRLLTTKQMQESPGAHTNARLWAVAREMMLGADSKHVSKMFGVGRNYAATLMRQVRSNGMLDELQAQANDLTVEVERENAEAAREAIGLFRRRMKEIDEKDRIEEADMADAFRIFDSTAPLTGVKEKKEKEYAIEKGQGSGQVNINQITLADIVGQDILNKAKDAKNRTIDI